MSKSWPIHRWLNFTDSCLPHEMEQLLDIANPGSSDTVYDPFTGCGTIPVICNTRGISTICSDIDCLAALTASIKLRPPSRETLNTLAQTVKKVDCNALLQKFASKELSNTFWVPILRPLMFLLSSALLRSGWYKGGELNVELFAHELNAVITEMEADTASYSPFEAICYVSCSDFLSVSVVETKARANRIIMVSTPPFYGSNTDPTRKLLSDLIDNPSLRLTRKQRPMSWNLPEAHAILERFKSRDELYHRVADYLFFLDCIAKQAKLLACRAIAIEMAARNVEGEVIQFDEFIAQRLTVNQYYVRLFQEVERESEACTIIYAEVC